LFFNDLKIFDKPAEFGHLVALRCYVKQLNKTGDTTMAMEKKSLVGKKTAAPTKGKSTKSKVDTNKPAASKVVAAKGGPGKGR
jgi:hypothetical protein